MAWWQKILLSLAWQFTKRAYGAGVGDKVLEQVRRLNDPADKRSGSEKFSDVVGAAKKDWSELPGELKEAGAGVAVWAVEDLVQSAVRKTRVEQNAPIFIQ